PLDAYENQLFEFERHLAFYQRLADLSIPHIVPPQDGKDWQTLTEAKPNPDVESWRRMLVAYGEKDATVFNAEGSAYLKKMQAERPKDARRASVEVTFNQLDPFNKAKWLYFVAYILSCLAWMGWSKTLNRSAWWLILFTFVVHLVALIVRMYLSGRPP